MAEAPRETLGEQKPSRSPLAEGKPSGSGRPIEGVNAEVLTLGGLGLLAYALYSLVRVVLSGDAGVGPEASLSRMSQLVSIYPVLLLGPLLLFIPQGARRQKGLWKGVSRWLVFLLAVMFLLFVPLAFLNQYQVTQADANQVQRFEALLQKRKQEILTAVRPLNSPEQFRSVLANFPEITQINIPANQTATLIRTGIIDGIDRGIKAEVDQLRARQRQRMLAITVNVRSVAAGSLIAGVTLFSLASWLLPWLNPAGQAIAHTLNGTGKGISTVTRRMRRWKPSLRLPRLLPRRGIPKLRLFSGRGNPLAGLFSRRGKTKGRPQRRRSRR
ncbi:MAG: hypothetical protein ACK522_14585 [Synechococcaceae cyanobacterium]|jgi:hypothetical protein